MAEKTIRDIEKVALASIRTAFQTWLAPQLSTIGERLTKVEARLDAMDKRFDRLDRRLDSLETQLRESLISLHNEMDLEAELADYVERMAGTTADLDPALEAESLRHIIATESDDE